MAGTVDVWSLLVVVDKAEVFDLQLLSKFKKALTNLVKIIKLRRILKLLQFFLFSVYQDSIKRIFEIL